MSIKSSELPFSHKTRFLPFIYGIMSFADFSTYLPGMFNIADKDHVLLYAQHITKRTTVYSYRLTFVYQPSSTLINYHNRFLCFSDPIWYESTSSDPIFIPFDLIHSNLIQSNFIYSNLIPFNMISYYLIWYKTLTSCIIKYILMA